MAGDEDVQAARLARVRAAAVRADTQPRLLELARWMRRRLPGDDRFGDALSTAGDAPAQLFARGVTALQPRRESVTHQLGLGALQVWQAVSEASGRGRGTTEVALLFTDLVGFSSWALKAGDEPAVELLRDELEDRFGPIPDPLANLIALQQARIKLGQAGAQAVTFRQGRLAVTPIELDSVRAKRLRENLPGALYESGKSQFSVRVPDDPEQRFPAVIRAADALLAVTREAA